MRIFTLTSFARRTLIGWKKFWRRVEGPELEPFLWHSHYLTYWANNATLKNLGSALTGEIIDIGAGTGHGSRFLNTNKATYFPTDLPHGRDAGDKSITSKAVPPFVYCSVYRMPFSDSHFNGGMILSVLEHLERPAEGLRELYRVIRPGGYLLISIPFAFLVHGAPFDYKRWTAYGIANEIKEAGFELVCLKNCGSGVVSLIANFHLLLKYHFLENNSIFRLIKTLLLPLILFLQLVLNLLALLLHRLDKPGAFPLSIIVLARVAK